MGPSSVISIAKAGNRTIIVPQESLTYDNCEHLEATFKECISQQRIHIILDCRAVHLMDSEALELLVGMHDETRKLGGTLKIVGLNEVCRDTLIATRLIYLDIHEDIHEAIRSGA